MVMIAVPTYDEGGINTDIHEHFGRCQSITIINIIEDQIKAVKVVPNIYSMEKGGFGVQAAHIISNNQVNEVIVRSLEYNVFNKLKSFNIKILKAPDDTVTVRELINNYLEGYLIQFSSTDVKAKYGNT